MKEFNNYFKKTYAYAKPDYDECMKKKPTEQCKREHFAPAVDKINSYADYLLEI